MRRNISKALLHPDWKTEFTVTSFDADIAILLMDSEVIFSNLIRPICLPDVSLNEENSILSGTVVGYGITETELTSKKPKHVEIPINNLLRCVLIEHDLATLASERFARKI